MSWVHLSISTISQLLLPWFWSIVAKRHFLSNIPIFNKKNVWILLYWIKWNRVIYQMCFCLFIPRYTRIQNFLKLCFEHNFLTQSFWLNLYSTFFLDQTSFDQNIFWTQKWTIKLGLHTTHHRGSNISDVTDHILTKL